MLVCHTALGEGVDSILPLMPIAISSLAVNGAPLDEALVALSPGLASVCTGSSWNGSVYTNCSTSVLSLPGTAPQIDFLSGALFARTVPLQMCDTFTGVIVTFLVGALSQRPARKWPGEQLLRTSDSAGTYRTRRLHHHHDTKYDSLHRSDIHCLSLRRYIGLVHGGVQHNRVCAGVELHFWRWNHPWR